MVSTRGVLVIAFSYGCVPGAYVCETWNFPEMWCSSWAWSSYLFSGELASMGWDEGDSGKVWEWEVGEYGPGD